MPKLKTNKAARKRFKITAKGKVLMSKPGRRHLMADKDSSEKRGLRRWREIDKTDRKRIAPLLPYQ